MDELIAVLSKHQLDCDYRFSNMNSQLSMMAEMIDDLYSGRPVDRRSTLTSAISALGQELNDMMKDLSEDVERRSQ